VTETVTQDAAVLSLVPSANPGTTSPTVSFTVTVTAAAPGGGTPTGTVVFKDRKKTLGTVALLGGSATFTPRKLALGIHSITVIFSGDPNFEPQTSAVLKEVIKKAKKPRKKN
jgi:Bacterial Ig-like domain (group 3)